MKRYCTTWFILSIEIYCIILDGILSIISCHITIHSTILHYIHVPLHSHMSCSAMLCSHLQQKNILWYVVAYCILLNYSTFSEWVKHIPSSIILCITEITALCSVTLYSVLWSSIFYDIQPSSKKPTQFFCMLYERARKAFSTRPNALSVTLDFQTNQWRISEEASAVGSSWVT